jgi:hypothetical protein
MALVAGVAVVAAIVRMPLGLLVLAWAACAWALVHAGRRRSPVPMLRAVLRALFPLLLSLFVLLTGLVWLVLLVALGRAQGP